MTAYVTRKGSMRTVEGNYSSSMSPLARELIWHYFVTRAILKTDATTQANHKLAVGASITLGLPAGYSNASVLFARIKTTGKINVTSISPVHGTRQVTVAGSSAVPGYFQIQERVTSIAISGATSDTVVTFFAFQVPDLTVATNFKGVTG